MHNVVCFAMDVSTTASRAFPSFITVKTSRTGVRRIRHDAQVRGLGRLQGWVKVVGGKLAKESCHVAFCTTLRVCDTESRDC